MKTSGSGIDAVPVPERRPLRTPTLAHRSTGACSGEGRGPYPVDHLLGREFEAASLRAAGLPTADRDRLIGIEHPLASVGGRRLPGIDRVETVNRQRDRHANSVRIAQLDGGTRGP